MVRPTPYNWGVVSSSEIRTYLPNNTRGQNLTPQEGTLRNSAFAEGSFLFPCIQCKRQFGKAGCAKSCQSAGHDVSSLGQTGERGRTGDQCSNAVQTREGRPCGHPKSSPETLAQPDGATNSASANISDSDPLVRRCHQLASNALPKELEKVIAACQAALKEYPTNADVQFQLGWALASTGSYDKAIPLLRKAADAGYASAQTFVGSLYRDGTGVDRDFGQAMSWYRKAASQGDQQALSEIRQMQ